tara:strand:- start:238 stop:552 length:315 start_codon:yes stop_codon:yes gene_type:complete
MPKFYRQNKRRVDPRYFLNESVEREDLIDDIREFSKDVAGSRDTYGDIDKLAVMDLAELEEYFQSLIGSEERKEVPTTRPVAPMDPPYDGPTREVQPIPPVEED